MNININNPWFLCITGICFCLAGCYQIFTNIYEEDRSLRPGLIIIIMGVILIAIGTARYFRLIP